MGLKDIRPNNKHTGKSPELIKSLAESIAVAFIAILLLHMCAGLALTGDASAAETDRYPKRVAVFISGEIKPYLQAVETINRRLDEDGQYRLKQIFFDASESHDLDAFKEQVEKGEYDLVLTVGTPTSRFMANCRIEKNVPVVYTMLINPEEIFNPDENISGVSLNIPIEAQLQEIKRTLPNINTIGVLFDVNYNAKFVNEAIKIGKSINLNVEAIEVNDKTSIPKALSANWYRIEALWLIPDWTVTRSDSINQYIIKEALLRKVPVIGYNRSFYNYGAALAMILDYEKIGAQTAEIVIDRLEKGISRTPPPAYETVVNERALKQMGIEAGNITNSEIELP